MTCAVIIAVDAGHWSFKGQCKECKVEWPCDIIKAARQSDKVYNTRNDHLYHRRMGVR